MKTRGEEYLGFKEQIEHLILYQHLPVNDGSGIKPSAFRKLPSIYVFSYFPFGFEGRMWDLIVSVPDHCLSFYFTIHYLIPSDRSTEHWKKYLKKSWADDFRTYSTTLGHQLWQGIKRDRNRKNVCAFRFLCCPKVCDWIFLDCFLHLILYQRLPVKHFYKMNIWILNNCGEYVMVSVVLQMLKWKWATVNVIQILQILLSSSERPNSLFSSSFSPFY